MKKTYLKYFSALLLFGSNGIAASYILLNSYEIVFLRTLTGSIFLLGILLLSRRKPQYFLNKRHVFYIVISGIAMGVSWMFLYEAYKTVGVSIATLAYYCGPVIVIAVSPLLFHERMTLRKLSGFTAVLAGMYLVNKSSLHGACISSGLVFGLLSAVMYAFMVIFNKKAKSITGLENSALQLIISFFTSAVFMMTRKPPAIPSVVPFLFPVLFLGIVNTGIGCYFYFSSIDRLPAGSVAVCGYIEPMSALLFSSLFLKERLSAVQLLGAFLILGGAILSEFSRKQKNP
ncbi:DMT family transporter [Anaerostipes sp.]|uniref:DMT family transporter n=1 Tax=Anaerostipes sp. TaxID=1872530 RepID=UPI0025C6AFD2|nr:DMT family transporter [Anaerostipes sp.]MBS7008346.1 EamA family transporter [Anaerostipes sp.]